MGLPIGPDGPQLGFPGGSDRINGVHLMTDFGRVPRFKGDVCYADDYIIMPLQCGTQIDALPHISYDGKIYNGRSIETITWRGAAFAGIEQVGGRLTGRGVLFDVPRFLGVEALSDDQLITPEMLDEMAEAYEISVLPGDIVLVRTGWVERYLGGEPLSELWARCAGLDFECVRWCYEHDIALICSDNGGVEAFADSDHGLTSPSVPGQALPFHMVAIRDMGLMLGELFDLREIASACASDGRYDFFFSAPVLKVNGAVGSPVNPVAVR